MDRVLKILIAVALFTGAGFVTRPLFQQWLESKLKEGQAANKKETGNWNPVQETANWNPVQKTANWNPMQGDFQENKMD